MVSNIDPTKPESGIDQPVSVIRDNFALAKIEIEELQAEKLDVTGGNMTGVLRLAPFNTGDLPDPTLNLGGLVFVTDASPTTPFFSDGTAWQSLVTDNLNDISDVNVGIPGVTENGFVLSWNNSAGQFQLTSAENLVSGRFIGSFTVLTLPDASANTNNLAFATDSSPLGMLFSDGSDWINSNTGTVVTT